MAWFKVDDALAFNMKAVAAGNEALGLWVRAGSWACQQLTDGFIPLAMVPALGGSDADAEALTAAGLWHEVAGGWEFHDWDEYQEPSEKVKERRAAARERMRAVRANKGRTKGERADEQDEKFAGSSLNPDPTRPDPTISTSNEVDIVQPRKRGTTKGTRIPEPFIVTADMRTAMSDECPSLDIDAHTRRFVDYWRAQPGQKGVKVDWLATWRNWMRRANDERPSQRPTRGQENLAYLQHVMNSTGPEEITA